MLVTGLVFHFYLNVLQANQLPGILYYIQLNEAGCVVLMIFMTVFVTILDLVMPPFEEDKLYCFANVGLSIGLSVVQVFLINNYIIPFESGVVR